MNKYVRVAIAVPVAGLFVGTFVFLYQKSRPQETVYEVFTLKRNDLLRTTVLTGSIEPRDEVLIKPQISGIVEQVYKEAGQTVVQGDVIAKVKVIPEMSSLSAAESRVRLARINAGQAQTDFRRMENLHVDKLISDEEFEKARQAHQQAQEELSASVDNLNIVKEGISRDNASYSTTLIRSTIDGLILDVPVKVGNSVIMSNTFNEGTTIASVADMGDLIFKGFVDETEVGLIKEGMLVEVTVGALQDRKFKAVLEYISPKVSEDVNNANQFEIKAAVRIPDSLRVRAGYSANAEIVLEQARQVWTVPEGAIEYKGDSTFVYVLTGNNPQQFERRPVRTGLSDGVNIEIKSGIRSTEKVRGLVVNEI